MPELAVEEMPTDGLVPYARNAKLHSDLQVGQIAASIEEFGFNDPVAVWENAQGELEIVEGHGRVMAAKKLGMGRVPVIRLDHMTNEQRRAYAHVHNQTTLSSGFDLDLLDIDLQELDFDWESFGFENGFDAIGDLVEEEFVSKGGSGDISVTFVFGEENAEAVKAYIGAMGKDKIAERIEQEALSWA